MTLAVGTLEAVRATGPSTSTVTVALLSWRSLFADALAAALAEHEALELAAVLTDLASAEAELSSHPVDVLLVVLGVSSDDDRAVMRRLLGRHPEVRVLALSMVDGDVADALAAGAAGSVTMDADLEEVVRTIRCVADGQTVLSERRAPCVVRSLTTDPGPGRDGTPEPLTPREREVLGRIVNGQLTRQMAAEMAVTLPTARTHVQNILNKLGVHSKLEAAAYATRHGLV